MCAADRIFNTVFPQLLPWMEGLSKLTMSFKILYDVLFSVWVNSKICKLVQIYPLSYETMKEGIQETLWKSVRETQLENKWDLGIREMGGMGKQVGQPIKPFVTAWWSNPHKGGQRELTPPQVVLRPAHTCDTYTHPDTGIVLARGHENIHEY